MLVFLSYVAFSLISSIFALLLTPFTAQNGVQRWSCRLFSQSSEAEIRLPRSQRELLPRGQLAGGALAFPYAQWPWEKPEVPASHSEGCSKGLQHSAWHRYWHWNPWVRYFFSIRIWKQFILFELCCVICKLNLDSSKQILEYKI